MKKRLISLLLITCILIGIINVAPLETNAANPDYSSIFVASYYSTRYPDLKAAGITTDAALLNHFVTSGMKEGRQGSEEFNVYVYMNNYPDLKAAFGNDLPKYYLHYINAGKAEGRVARGNASAPATTVPTTPTVNSGALHTTPAYPVTNLTFIKGNPRFSYLTVKVGDNIGTSRTVIVTQNNLNNWNYNPYGLTSGTSAITGSASIGDIRYINYSLYEHYTMKQPHSVKMECYAINKNGVPLFREYGSNYNVYTQAKNIVPAIDAITPSMTKESLVSLPYPKTYNCTEASNIRGAVFSQILVEAYHVVSETYNHEECLIYAGNNSFYSGTNVIPLSSIKLTANTVPGTFKVYYSDTK